MFNSTLRKTAFQIPTLARHLRAPPSICGTTFPTNRFSWRTPRTRKPCTKRCALLPGTSHANSDYSTSHTDSQWPRSNGWGGNGLCAPNIGNFSMPLSSSQRPTDEDILQKHDPWQSLQLWQDDINVPPAPPPSDPYPLHPRIAEARVCKVTSFIK